MAMSEFRHMMTSFFDSWNIGDSHFSSITRMVQSLMVVVNYPDEATNDYCISVHVIKVYYGNFLFMHTFVL